jgi:predicted DNA-binding transcriptional regulator AlpA
MSVERRAGRRPRPKFLSTAAALTDRPTDAAPCDQGKPSDVFPLQPPTHPNQDVLLTDFDLERITDRARSTWQKARLMGTGPPFIRLGRLVRYRTSEFNAWLSAHPSLRSTSDEAEVLQRKFEDKPGRRGLPRKVSTDVQWRLDELTPTRSHKAAP